ncbi:MAG TPA: translational GTPase TypA, partial [Candidatus Paceibacterota bacterium]
IRERLYNELESDVALRVEDVPPTTNSKAGWVVSGRGELHLAILIERMRREGYEFQVSRPQVINKTIDGKTRTPFDDVSIEVPEAYSGVIMQRLGSRKGELTDMRTENGITYLDFSIPTRGMFGYRQEFITDTKGLGIMHVVFDEYRPDPGNWKDREQGSLVAHETGITRLYGMLNVQGQGSFFIGPGEQVYKGQVVGQRSRPKDLAVNVCKEKELSNMRSKNQGIDDHFDQPRRMDLEDSLEYIGDDELVEVTPKSVRIRKMVLDEMEERRRQLGIKN